MSLIQLLIAGVIYLSVVGNKDVADNTTVNQEQSASTVVTESAPQEKLSTPEVEKAPATPPEITANIETQKEEQVVASTVEPTTEEKPVEQEQPATPAVEEKEPPTETSNTKENQPEVAAQSSTPIEVETTSSTNWVKIIIYIAVGIFVIAGGLYFFVNRQKQYVQSAADQAKAKYEERQRERDQEEMGTSEPEQTNSPESSEDSNNSDDPNKQGP